PTATSMLIEATFRTALTMLLVLAWYCATVSSRAWADGDPVSDVLLGQSAFYPYKEAAMKTLEREKLAAELAAGEEMLRSATVARLAYNGTDGTPRVIPIAFSGPGRQWWSAPTRPHRRSQRSAPGRGWR
ncbi:MAG TPA: hypothetical protein VFV03_08340, partial [Solirubrobacteraceae bacterium]|nr:hypothetical protein [Solirubrobacteraceae bacterium]